MRILLDTCIIIDALQAREPFREDAEKIFLHAANNHYTGYITAKSVTDIYYLTHRYTHSDQESRRILSSLFTIFQVLDTDAIDCQKAILSDMSDYEDAVMVETALRTEIDYIITRNVKDYSRSKIRVLQPCEFLQLL